MSKKIFEVEVLDDGSLQDAFESWAVYAGYYIDRNGNKHDEYVWIEEYEDGIYRVENEFGNNIGKRDWHSYEDAYDKAKQIIKHYIERGITQTDEDIDKVLNEEYNNRLDATICKTRDGNFIVCDSTNHDGAYYDTNSYDDALNWADRHGFVIDKGNYYEERFKRSKTLKEDYNKNEVIDELVDYMERHPSNEGSIEIWTKEAKYDILDWFRQHGYKFNVSGNDRAGRFSYHVEYYK